MLLVVGLASAAPCPTVTVEAELLIASEGRVVAEDVSATTCCCANPAWTLEAREGELEGEQLTLRGATARVYGVPVMWLPWARVELGPTRRYVGVPRFGRGFHGWQVSVPLVDEGPGHRLEIAPELRQGGGFRGLAGIESEIGTAQASVTPDGRGALDGDLGVLVDGVPVGWAGALVSDAGYLDEFADSWLVRSQGWTRSTFAVGTGPVSLDGLIWRDDALNAAVGLPVRVERGAVAAGGRVDLVGADLRSEVDLSVAEDWRLGAIEAELDGGARTVSVLGSGSSSVDGVIDGRVALPFWAQGGRRIWQWEPAVVAGAGRRFAQGETLDLVSPTLGADPRLDWRTRGWLDDSAPQSLWAGPALGVARGLVRAQVEVPWTGSGPIAVGSLGARRGPVRGDVRGTWTGDDWLVASHVRADLGRVGLTAGSVDTAELHQWRAGADVGLSLGSASLRPGVGAVASPEGLDELGVRAMWASGCDCLSVGGSVGWAEDRQGLVGGLTVSVQ
ncbi:MAG: hypothetical protein GY913_00220 [Proteobacteria bacterium]|nr:hypothetical protein [Pseudomonadota bacterium]MCP4915322.1 hypothetical protein [Pseudomonadota bacterium]